jgi:hypothetical protein
MTEKHVYRAVRSECRGDRFRFGVELDLEPHLAAQPDYF